MRVMGLRPTGTFPLVVDKAAPAGQPVARQSLLLIQWRLNTTIGCDWMRTVGFGGNSMRVSSMAILAAAAFLTGCATAPKMTWLRVDGQRSRDNPLLATQFELDSTSCIGERNKANLSGVTMTGGGIIGAMAAAERSNAADTVQRGCMAEKGYLLVPEDQAEARQTELAAIAEQKRQHENAANAASSKLRRSKPAS